jgi:hypothetical protein
MFYSSHNFLHPYGRGGVGDTFRKVTLLILSLEVSIISRVCSVLPPVGRSPQAKVIVAFALSELGYLHFFNSNK